MSTSCRQNAPGAKRGVGQASAAIQKGSAETTGGQPRRRTSVETLGTPRIAMVLETNVLLDLLTWHGPADSAGERRTYAIRRAGGALRLAIHLHSVRGVTWNLRHEPARKLVEYSAPDDFQSPRTAFTRFAIFFVKDQLLDGWTIQEPRRESKSLKGTAADTVLLRKAEALGVPLITSEGYSHAPSQKPPRKSSLRARAASVGVQVCAPEEYALGKVSDRDIEQFMNRFRERAPEVYRGHEHYDRAQHHLEVIYRYYAMALRLAGNP
jgi:hypothetical protein